VRAVVREVRATSDTRGDDISASLRFSQYRKWRRKHFEIEPACTRPPFELNEPHAGA
jgi:hypothetical protein